MAPYPILCRPNTSCDIPNMLAPGWKFIVFNLVTFSARTILRNCPMKTFRVPCIYSKFQDTRSTSSIYETHRLRTTACPSPSCMTSPSSTARDIQCLTTLFTTTLKSMGGASTPWVMLQVFQNWESYDLGVQCHLEPFIYLSRPVSR